MDLSDLHKECGGHRIQRVPPTEKKGRVHTSTVTVAIIEPDSFQFCIKESDLEIEWFSGTGAGGQKRNKCQNSCRLKHKPTGIICSSQCRSRENSLQQAKIDLEKKVKEFYKTTYDTKVSTGRKDQVGSGMRGDKIRTYRFQDDQVHDHLSDKKASVSQVMKGNFNLLW